MKKLTNSKQVARSIMLGHGTCPLWDSCGEVCCIDCEKNLNQEVASALKGEFALRDNLESIIGEENSKRSCIWRERTCEDKKKQFIEAGDLENLRFEPVIIDHLGLLTTRIPTKEDKVAFERIGNLMRGLLKGRKDEK